MVKVQKHMNAEDAMIARRGGEESEKRKGTNESGGLNQSQGQGNQPCQLEPKEGTLKS